MRRDDSRCGQMLFGSLHLHTHQNPDELQFVGVASVVRRSIVCFPVVLGIFIIPEVICVPVVEVLRMRIVRSVIRI